MGKKQTFASDTSQRSITDWIRALLVLLLGLIIAHSWCYALFALGTWHRYFHSIYSGVIPGCRIVCRNCARHCSVYFDGSDVVNNQRICQTRNHCLCILRRPYH